MDGCNAPYNLGCENMHGEAVCICPECDDILDVVCSSDDVQDRSKCMVKRQSCLVGKEIDIVQERPCGRSSVSFRRFSGDVVQEGRGATWALLSPRVSDLPKLFYCLIRGATNNKFFSWSLGQAVA